MSDDDKDPFDINDICDAVRASGREPARVIDLRAGRPLHITSAPLILMTRWADTAYNGNGERLYTDDEIAAAKDAIVRLDRVLGEAKAILAIHRINERDEGHWGDLWCAVAAATAPPITKASADA